MPSIRVRILKKTHPQHTSGPSVQSPTYLTSGAAAASWLGSEMNTATVTLFDSIILSESRASTSPAKKRSRRATVKASETRLNFDMMPAYAARQQAATESLMLRAVNTPLAKKAQEEMSDFERDYPW